MGVTRYYEIYCDGCGDSPDTMEPYLADLRAYARKLGWKTKSEGHMTSHDLCPKCVSVTAKADEHGGST